MLMVFTANRKITAKLYYKIYSYPYQLSIFSSKLETTLTEIAV